MKLKFVAMLFVGIILFLQVSCGDAPPPRYQAGQSCVLVNRVPVIILGWRHELSGGKLIVSYRVLMQKDDKTIGTFTFEEDLISSCQFKGFDQ